MRNRKHKRRHSQVLILTSDAVDAPLRQWKIKTWVAEVVLLIFCAMIGGVIGFFLYEGQLWQNVNAKYRTQVEELTAQNEELQAQKSSLEAQVAEQAEEIQILGDTVSQKVQAETELSETIEAQSIPSEYPLTGSASMEELTDGENPILVLHASEGSMVVATASGTVTAVNDDETYGHSVWVDHGNGYITIYRNKGDAMVSVGDSVVQGATLFIVSSDNTDLGYQMQQDGVYINPIDVLSISG